MCCQLLRNTVLYWHIVSNEITYHLYVFALFFQKSSLIILNLIMITCYHDNSLIGPIAHLSLSLCLLFLWLSLSLSLSLSFSSLSLS